MLSVPHMSSYQYVIQHTDINKLLGGISRPRGLEDWQTDRNLKLLKEQGAPTTAFER